MINKKAICSFLILNVLIFALSAPLIAFYGPFPSLQIFTVSTIMTSRHPQVAEFFLSKEKIAEITRSYQQQTISVEPVIISKENFVYDYDNGIRIEEIKGKNFKGKVMLIKNPAQVKVAVTSELGTAGQRLSQLINDHGAIAGINGGGFYDPDAQGNGAFPDGITVVEGRIVHNCVENDSVDIIAFNEQGKLVLKKISIGDIQNLGINNAVSFYPNLILDSKPQIQGDGGWGLAPRTGIGQKPDGTVIFVVIDGRQPGWSMGATLRDLMNIFIEYGAYQAANLDGGSSTEMIYNNRIINRLWNIYGERYIPTAFVVMPR